MESREVLFVLASASKALKAEAALDDLRAIEGRGTNLLLCGTCVNAFDLKDGIAVGAISNMYAISETMLRAASVINI